ncbi:MAG: AMP-binding protein [Sandaracinaceae bacterium]|nr:AMP-binding protein [Sandaracinaceae bacterium]
MAPASRVALLQYTSGSTSQPRGVRLTHDNLIDNARAICQRFRHHERSHGVIWLPPYHDMGLMGGLFQPLYVGFPVVLVPALSFVQRPHLWLRLISDWKATTSGGPCFGYDLCVRRLSDEQLEGLDLSSWSLAFVGAEPVRPTVLDRFAARFARCGFRAQAFYPCYGLAEATLMSAGPADAADHRLLEVERDALERGRCGRRARTAARRA